VSKRRGFFAEINHQAALAERRRHQQNAVAARSEAAASKAAEKARREAERAAAVAARASASDRKAAEQEAARLRVDAQLAEVGERNAMMALRLEEIDGLLAYTLAVDDYVDLASLKAPVGQHPPFDPGSLGTPNPPQPPLVYPPEPAFQEPAMPSGLAGAFGGKKKHAEMVAKASADHQFVVRRWQKDCQDMYAAHLAEHQRLQSVEAERSSRLQQSRLAYELECDRRDAEARHRNGQVDQLINDLAFDVPEAIEQYVDIVLSNSAYPDTFPVTFDHEFDLAARELRVAVTVPDPEAVLAVKEYRYVKAKDEIVSTALPVKAQKDRYASAVWQVAVRTLHEVFEADRAEKISSISVTVGTDRRSPGTGLPETIPLVTVAADRATFTRFDLANVVPAATLEYLGAALSKSPYDLVPANVAPGVGVRRTT